jgi:hypothetical protein
MGTRLVKGSNHRRSFIIITTSVVCIYDIYDMQFLLSLITPCLQVPSDLIVILYLQLGLLFGDHASHFLGWMASLNEIGCFYGQMALSEKK